MSFVARYRGDCAACDEPIEPGQEVYYDLTDELCHIKCPESLDEMLARVERCPRCFAHHPGEC